ncbi:isoprenylcysteine carboxylmethyltransferase family protein [Caproiciproducens galactitolivorans]|nr:isoprenylcysteine carboxylmethyltransferase family protein [Caproiciproducens galactitolivorans]
MVLSRILFMRRKGIKALKFGETDKKDFLIPPFGLLYFYLILANAFNLPKLGFALFHNEMIRWVGAGLCILGLFLFLSALISFGMSLRVGIDKDHPGPLVTSGAFAISRNPLYIAFGLVLIGIFFIFPNSILFLYLIAGLWLLNRQVLREEDSLKKIYGEEYRSYCKKVRRYL